MVLELFKATLKILERAIKRKSSSPVQLLRPRMKKRSQKAVSLAASRSQTLKMILMKCLISKAPGKTMIGLYQSIARIATSSIALAKKVAVVLMKKKREQGSKKSSRSRQLMMNSLDWGRLPKHQKRLTSKLP